MQAKLKELEATKAPHDAVREQARKFVESWTDIGQLLDQAEPAEQQIILQHFVQSLELKSADKSAKQGTYILRLFPEVGPLDAGDGEKDHDPGPGDFGNGAVLTANGLVRQLGKRTPREQPSSE